MRMRSTGLGATELVGEISDVKPVGDYLVVHVGTTEPVRWHVRTAMSISDLLKITWLLLKPSSLLFLLTHFFRKPKRETLPDF